MKNKMGRPPSQWLFDLPNGQYSVQMLQEISGTSGPNIAKRMRIYAKNIVLVRSENNRPICMYEWDSEYFLDKINQQE